VRSVQHGSQKLVLLPGVSNELAPGSMRSKPVLVKHCVFRYNSGYSNYNRFGAVDHGYKELVRRGNNGSYSHTR
jgi:hypothetical protein